MVVAGLFGACIETTLGPAITPIGSSVGAQSATTALEGGGQQGDSARMCSVLSTLATDIEESTCSPIEFGGFEVRINTDIQFTTDESERVTVLNPIAQVVGGRVLLGFGYYGEDDYSGYRWFDPTNSDVFDLAIDEAHTSAATRPPGTDPSAVFLAVEQQVLGTACIGETGHAFLDQYLAGAPFLIDLDHDGVPEVLDAQNLLDAECNLLAQVPGDAYHSSSVVVVSGDVPEGVVATGDGFLDLATGIVSPIGDLYSDGAQVADIAYFTFGVLGWEGHPIVIGSDGIRMFGAELDGTVLWNDFAFNDGQDPRNLDRITAGDLDGDGKPEIVSEGDDSLLVTSLEGEVITRIKHPMLSHIGGIAMADLDADLEYEVIWWGFEGLFVFDGIGLRAVASNTEIMTRLFWTDPLVADIDGDGSAEIVVVGTWKAFDDVGYEANHIFVLGPAAGRWARTRPVWNQTMYDPTTIRDDGTMVVFPKYNWETYNTSRAQPAHDGDFPDLRPKMTEVCATECGPGGMIELNVVVENPGSRDAPAGSRVVLSRWSETDRTLVPVAEAFLPAVPAGTASAGIVFAVRWEEWGDQRVLEVMAGHDDECDLANDRIEVWDDPCAVE